MKKLISTLIFILITVNLQAIIYISNSNGNWNLVATWNTTPPPYSTSDNLTINHSVTSSTNVTIKANGVLRITSTGTLTINSDLEFSNGSLIIVEDGGQIIVNGNFVNKNNSDAVTIDGSMDVSGNFDNGQGGIIDGNGAIDVDGEYTGEGVTFGYQPTNNITDNTEISGDDLPVEFVDLKIYEIDGSICVEWVVASETNNDYFIVERSVDGYSFIEVGVVDGSGTINEYKTYTFSDSIMFQNIIYYRIKQVDFNGNFEYFGPQSIKILNESNVIQLFPNPGKNVIIVFCNKKIEPKIYINFYDVTGKKVKGYIIDGIDEGEKNTINIEDINKGVYLIYIKSELFVNVTKFVKQ